MDMDNSNQKLHRAQDNLLMIAMFSIIMLFAGLTSAYIVSKARPDWLKNFDLPISFSISTLIISISSCRRIT